MLALQRDVELSAARARGGLGPTAAGRTAAAIPPPLMALCRQLRTLSSPFTGGEEEGCCAQGGADEGCHAEGRQAVEGLQPEGRLPRDEALDLCLVSRLFGIKDESHLHTTTGA